jgi:hypothetical protein
MNRIGKAIVPAGLAVCVLLVGAVPSVAVTNLDSATADAGLREALQVGVNHAVSELGRIDGYLDNPDVRIPIPDEFEQLSKMLRTVGLDSVMDEFETSMNRAAEAAAPLAREVFVEAIKQMSITDAIEIVRGEGHEATDYLRKHAEEELTKRFTPIVSDQLDAVGATRSFNELMDSTADLPFVSKPVFDLEDYVTNKALDGMFFMIAREEEKIREDPLARTTDLLKTVFGGAADREEKIPWWKRLFGD